MFLKEIRMCYSVDRATPTRSSCSFSQMPRYAGIQDEPLKLPQFVQTQGQRADMPSWIFCSWSAHVSVAEHFLFSEAHGNERFCRLPVKSYCAPDAVTAPVLAFPGMVKERKVFLGTCWGWQARERDSTHPSLMGSTQE